MQLNDDLHVLPLPMVRDGQTRILNLSLIVDPAAGPTLVDAGLPGQLDAIAAVMAEAGVGVGDLKRIVLTHQDIDHVGSLPDLVQASGARVLANEVEVPFIVGAERPRYDRPDFLQQFPQMAAFVERMKQLHVDEALPDGARLDVAGGVRAVATPGHTVGHMCLYLERSRTVIAGDALTAEDGRLQGPSPTATADMPTAVRSVARLAELDVDAIVCYHGGVVSHDAGGQLRRLAGELAR
jgi:glyoxylase-like metal-dependent hydrolase (beta-lactamase superfamily II)